MNEKRAFWMLVGFGALAIIVNGMALMEGYGSVAIDSSSQLAQVSSVLPDLTIDSLVRNADGSLSVKVKNIGSGTIPVPVLSSTSPSMGVAAQVCLSLGITPTSSSPVPYDNQVCAGKDQYPVTAGKVISIKLPGAMYAFFDGSPLMIGVDGVYPEVFKQPLNQVYGFLAEQDLVVEANEKSNNSKTITIPTRNLAAQKVVIDSVGKTAQSPGYCKVTTSTNAADSCCNKPGTTCPNFPSHKSGVTDPANWKAVDGDKNTFWCSKNLLGVGDTAWVYVDLGAQKTFDQIIITQATSSQTSGISSGPFSCGQAVDYQIQTSVDAVNWVTQKTGAGDQNHVKTVDLSTPVQGRYVRLLATKMSGVRRLSVREFEVYKKITATTATLTTPIVPKVMTLAELGEMYGMNAVEDAASGKTFIVPRGFIVDAKTGQVIDPKTNGVVGKVCGWYLNQVKQCYAYIKGQGNAESGKEATKEWQKNPQVEVGGECFGPKDSPKLYVGTETWHDSVKKPPIPLRPFNTVKAGPTFATANFGACTKAAAGTVVGVVAVLWAGPAALLGFVANLVVTELVSTTIWDNVNVQDTSGQQVQGEIPDLSK